MLRTIERGFGTNPLDTLLADLERQRFFGSIEFKLEAGRVVLIRKTETLKPESDHRNNRGAENDSACR